MLVDQVGDLARSEPSVASAGVLPLVVVGAPFVGIEDVVTAAQSDGRVQLVSESTYFDSPRWLAGAPGFERRCARLGGLVGGEYATRYVEPERFDRTVRRLRMVLPDVRIVLVVRDPVDLLVRHAEARAGQAPRAAARGRSRALWYARRGLQLATLRHYYLPESIAVVDASFAARDPYAAREVLFRFLGLDAGSTADPGPIAHDARPVPVVDLSASERSTLDADQVLFERLVGPCTTVGVRVEPSA